MHRGNRSRWDVVVTLVLFVIPLLQARAQGRQETGKPIGKVSVAGDLILLELDEGALGKANMFDLGKRTLRFRPDGAGYRVENLPLLWDSEFGAELYGP